MLPINSTESFGMVQVEAMTCGTPVVASDLPGVRQPARMTGMGKIIPPADALPWRRRSSPSWNNPTATGATSAVAQRFSPDAIAAEYEGLFRELIDKN